MVLPGRATWSRAVATVRQPFAFRPVTGLPRAQRFGARRSTWNSRRSSRLLSAPERHGSLPRGSSSRSWSTERSASDESESGEPARTKWLVEGPELCFRTTGRFPPKKPTVLRNSYTGFTGSAPRTRLKVRIRHRRALALEARNFRRTDSLGGPAFRFSTDGTEAGRRQLTAFPVRSSDIG